MIEVNNKSSELRDIARGVLQDCLIFPLLFNVGLYPKAMMREALGDMVSAM